MSDPKPEELMSTEEFQGWVKAQSYATAQLWAFQLLQQSYTINQARDLFDNMLRSYGNVESIETIPSEGAMNVRLDGLSHLEDILASAISLMQNRIDGKVLT